MKNLIKLSANWNKWNLPATNWLHSKSFSWNKNIFYS